MSIIYYAHPEGSFRFSYATYQNYVNKRLEIDPVSKQIKFKKLSDAEENNQDLIMLDSYARGIIRLLNKIPRKHKNNFHKSDVKGLIYYDMCYKSMNSDHSQNKKNLIEIEDRLYRKIFRIKQGLFSLLLENDTAFHYYYRSK
jgi:hypothetical protein